MSQNLIIQKLFGTVPVVVIFIVDNSYINEGENTVIGSYLMLGTKIFTPSVMIKTLIIFLASIILKSN